MHVTLPFPHSLRTVGRTRACRLSALARPTGLRQLDWRDARIAVAALPSVVCRVAGR
ncbi:hypothetical protein [Ottowia sp.]|uniref:hypothetical protein n=1 Tax=Ottowia sp. TaxID=1898956 RepID=UPI002C1FF0BB|nr:hypothetical protein [Ottowia sp.]HOB67806.1 hypothetical protein [Ottowia sp.]